MPNIFIIMGDRNTRKSATIRALTGVFHGGVYKVATKERDIDVFVQISSFQESKMSSQDFIGKVNENNYSNVLVALWVSKGNKQPNGFTYIQDFLDASYNIQQIVVLGTNNLPYDLPKNTPNPNYIHNSQNLPANRIASRIRRWWQWL